MKKIKAFIWCMVLILCAIPVITDTFGIGTNIQYAYNVVYLLLILPAGIVFSGIVSMAHPEYYEDGRRDS